MIQRIQTLLLLLAIGFIVTSFFVPFGYAPVVDELSHKGVLEPLNVSDFSGLVVPAVVSVVLIFIAIFLYKNYKLQKLFTILGAISIVVTLGVEIYAVINPYIGTNPTITVATVWGVGGLFPVGALIADIVAYHYISKDQKLIRSYDRIR